MLPGLEQIVARCAPQVAPVTMTAIVRVESAGNPLALHINGAHNLARQPESRYEAIAWADWLVRHGYSVDMGLAQVNSRQLPRLGATIEQMFEPCANLAAAARILSENYAAASRKFGDDQNALLAAISAYNTGNQRDGFGNGYVARVAAAAYPTQAPPLIEAAEAVGQPGSPLVFRVKR